LYVAEESLALNPTSILANDIGLPWATLQADHLSLEQIISVRSAQLRPTGAPSITALEALLFSRSLQADNSRAMNHLYHIFYADRGTKWRNIAATAGCADWSHCLLLS
jgi:hypothetical protein